MSEEDHTTHTESTVITAIARLYAQCFTLIAVNQIIQIYESSTRYTTVSRQFPSFCQFFVKKRNSLELSYKYCMFLLYLLPFFIIQNMMSILTECDLPYFFCQKSILPYMLFLSSKMITVFVQSTSKPLG